MVIIPNFGSWQRKLFGSRWFHLDLPRHRIHFTLGSLERAIQRAGLSVERIGTRGKKKPAGRGFREPRRSMNRTHPNQSGVPCSGSTKRL